MRFCEIISFFAIGDLLSALELCDNKNNSISFFNIRTSFRKLCEQLKNCQMLRMVCFTMTSQFRADDFGTYSLLFKEGGWGGV